MFKNLVLLMVFAFLMIGSVHAESLNELDTVEKLAYEAEKKYGAGSYEHALLLNDVAKTKLALGKNKEAFDILSKIHPILNKAYTDLDRNEHNKRRKAKGELHKNWSVYYRNIAMPNTAYIKGIMAESFLKENKEELKEELLEIHIERAHDLYFGKKREEALLEAQNALIVSVDNFGYNHPLTAKAMIQLGEICLGMGNRDEARMLLENVLPLCQNIFGNNHPQTLRAMNVLSEIYVKNNDVAKAKPLVLNALEIVKTKPAPLWEDIEIEAGLLANMTEINKKSKDYQMAKKYAEELMNFSKKHFGYGESDYRTVNASLYLAEASLDIGDYKNAIYWCEEIVKLLNNPRKVLMFNNDNTASYVTNNDLKNIYAHERIMGEAYTAMGDYTSAIPHYETFIANTERERARYRTFMNDDAKTEWFSLSTNVYQKAADAYINVGRKEDAFKTLELCKARSLTENYSDQMVENASIYTKEDAENFRKLRLEINKNQSRIVDSKNNNDVKARVESERDYSFSLSAYYQFKESLPEKYQRYKDFLTMEKIDDIHKFPMSSDVCYVNFTILENKILAIALAHEGVFSVPIFNSENISEIGELYRAISSYQNLAAMNADKVYLWRLSSGKYRLVDGRRPPESGAQLIKSEEDFLNVKEKLSSDLGEILIKPLVTKSELSGKTHYILSPDGSLALIPWETLSHDGKMAIQYGNISYVPSLSMLSLIKERENRKSKHIELLAIGNPPYGESSKETLRGAFRNVFKGLKDKKPTINDLPTLKWYDLPGTAKEIENIGSLFSNKMLLKGKDASESNLKAMNLKGEMSKYKYILFATHGIFVPEVPKLSSIVLSQADTSSENDGYITIGEFMSYNLDSDLVYLSACESGLGESVSGEGIIGLPYALTVAGNKNTVMSLWKVDDEATAEFSLSFFRKLKQGKDAVNALSETKREFMNHANEKYRSPSVWAAFVLYGI